MTRKTINADSRNVIRYDYDHVRTYFRLVYELYLFTYFIKVTKGQQATELVFEKNRQTINLHRAIIFFNLKDN